MFLSSSFAAPSYLPTSRWKLHSFAAELRYLLSDSMSGVDVEQDGECLVLTGHVASEPVRKELCKLAHELAFGVPVLCMVAVLAKPGLTLV